jgi:hypothetical protein
MFALLWRLALVTAACGIAVATRADGPDTLPPPRLAAQPDSDVLPQPRPFFQAVPASPGPMVPVYASPLRRNPYEVWQNYGVGRQGRFRPLVIYSPYGPYYRYNGQPYPWAPTHGLEFMSYIVD